MLKEADTLKLEKKIRSLKAKNKELSDTLKMIKRGQVDSLVIAGPFGGQVFTLQTAGQPFRQLIETMNEGIVTLSAEGLILYCNTKFQKILKLPSEQLLGSDIRAHIQPDSRHTLEFILERSQIVPSRVEVNMHAADSTSVSVQFSMSRMKLDGLNGFSLVVTDLSTTKRNAVLFQHQEWLGKILNRFPVPLLLVEEDMKGFTFINEKAKAMLKSSSSVKGESSKMSFSFLNENGQIFELSDLLQRVQLYGGQNGYETNLVVNDRRIPVLLFVESLPSVQGMATAKLLLFQDLTHLKQAQQDLSQALRGRDQFVSALSHELRTPLNAILGWVQLLRSHPTDRHILDQGLDTLNRNANLQRDLIEDLLDMSRIMTGNLVLEKKPLDINQILDELISGCEMKALEKSVNIFVKKNASPVVILADPKRTQQLISHLIYNAIKFNHRGGHVEINLAVDSLTQQALIEVKDDGQGIDPAFLPHVFDQFKQENMSTNRSYGGLGLGLAICRTIVAEHGGEISVTSDGIGHGATFTVRMPLAAQMPVSAAATVAHSATQVDLRGLRVLMVDDSADNLALFTIWLRKSGAEIKTMDSATGVIEAINEFRPHVLLSDISMPGEDGYSLIAKVRSMSPQNGGTIPAGAITAHVRTEDRDLSIAAGYHMHIPKPVTAFSLAKAVKSLSEMNHIH